MKPPNHSCENASGNSILFLVMVLKTLSLKLQRLTEYALEVIASYAGASSTLDREEMYRIQDLEQGVVDATYMVAERPSRII